MKRILLIAFTGLMLIAGSPLGLIETYEFSNPELEVRYQRLSEELRCPKCQNQTIEDSNAPIAQDLRKLLHQQLEQGASDEEIPLWWHHHRAVDGTSFFTSRGTGCADTYAALQAGGSYR